MKKIPIQDYVKAMLKLQEQGEYASLLGIGPMSPNLIKASLELAKDFDFPIMYIASRNQVDKDELGGGYVNGWDQKRFHEDIQKVAKELDCEGYYYLCRDHGGPWQRDKERNDHLPEAQAMDIAKESYVADMENGFDLLMIDPTKDPFEMGKVIPLETVISRTIELIEFCEIERKKRNLPEIGYEVGTEETNGGLTTTERYEEFVQKLKVLLEEKDLPMPTFIVGQTGTLTRKTEQVGHFNYRNAYDLSVMAKKYGVGLKEHNGDYLDDKTLLLHLPSGVTAINVAPQYGTEETRAYLSLCEVEDRLYDEGVLEHKSNLKAVLLEKAIKTGRWRKWMVGDQVNLTIEEILSNHELSLEVLDIAGHYAFNDEEVKKEISILYENMRKAHIDGNRYVIEHIKRPIKQYIECLNLAGINKKVLKVLNG